MRDEKNIIEKALEPASFIALKATASTGVLINEFPHVFRDEQIQKQFYLDMLCLHLDIYHRLGAGLINPDDDSCVPSFEELDERIATVAGTALGLVNSQCEPLSFTEGITIELLQTAFATFHNWSVKFTSIHDTEDSLLCKFGCKWARQLRVSRKGSSKFASYLSDSIRQYLHDPRFVAICTR